MKASGSEMFLRTQNWLQSLMESQMLLFHIKIHIEDIRTQAKLKPQGSSLSKSSRLSDIVLQERQTSLFLKHVRPMSDMEPIATGTQP